MKFKIALFGSFKDSNGYTWKLPDDVGQAQLQRVVNCFLKTYEDGRHLLLDEVYGGFFVDVAHQMFYAFRFINGGQDSRGRDGVVITNWAVTQYSEVKGKNIRTLFDALIFKQLPNTCEIDIPVLSSFEFGSSGIFIKEGSMTGDSVDSIFNLPITISRDILVQFELKENEKNAVVKYLSREIMHQEAPKKAPPKHSQIKPQRNSHHWNSFPYHRVFAGVLIFSMLLIIIPLLFQTKNQENPPPQTPQAGSPGTLVRVDDDSLPDSNRKVVFTRKPQQESVLSFWQKNTVDINSFSICLSADKEIYSWYDEKSNQLCPRSSCDIKLGNAEFNLGIYNSELLLSVPEKRLVPNSNSRHFSFSVLPGANKERFDLIIEDSFWEIKFAKNHQTLSDRLQKAESYLLKDGDNAIARLSIDMDSIRFENYSHIPIVFVSANTDTPPKYDMFSSSSPIIVFYFYKITDMQINNPQDRQSGGRNKMEDIRSSLSNDHEVKYE